MTTTPDDELTELVDADFPRVDLVKQGANGVPRFLIAKADADGLLDPEYVRDLISKSEPGTGSEETVTMTGSPAAIAKLMREGGLALARPADADEVFLAKALAAYPGDPAEVAKSKLEYDEVVKAKYNADDKKRMAASGAAMDDESYPIEDEEDLDNAIHAVGRGGASHNAIRKHIIKRAKSLGKSSKIPDTWGADGSLKEPVSKDAADVLDVVDPELDEGTDGMDPTVPFTGPDNDDAPGDATEPGSPAWEAIDAATAQKWLAIASRLQNAMGMLSDREMLEAATGADPDDADKAWSLQDAMCAVQYAIEQLAVFAAGEQASAEMGAEMDAIGKALAGFDPEPLAVVEGLTAVRKAGRVLSAANEQLIKEAAGNLQRVLSSLPAPVEKEAGQQAAEQEGDGAMAQPESSADRTAESGQAPAMGTASAGSTKTKTKGKGKKSRRVAKAVAGLPVVVFNERREALGHVKADAITRKVAKAASDGDGDGTTLQAVFDQDGDLIGVVDPTAIQPVAGAAPAKTAQADSDGAAHGATDAGGGGSTPEPSTAAAGDLTPAPAASTGTPAEGVAKSEPGTDDGEPAGSVAKSDQTDNNEEITALKSAVDQVTETLAHQSAEHSQVVAKMAADNERRAEEVRTLKQRLETVEATPAAPKVMARGQVPPAAHLRGQDQGQAAATVDVAKARGLKETLYRGTAQEQNAAFGEMQEMAIAGLAAMHARGPGRS